MYVYYAHVLYCTVFYLSSYCYCKRLREKPGVALLALCELREELAVVRQDLLRERRVRLLAQQLNEAAAGRAAAHAVRDEEPAALLGGLRQTVQLDHTRAPEHLHRSLYTRKWKSK